MISEAVAEMRANFRLRLGADRIGGDNLAPHSSRSSRSDHYVNRRRAGDKIPLKEGPASPGRPFSCQNKIDLAPHVARRGHDGHRCRRMRGARPFVMNNLRKSEGLERIIGS